MLNRSLRSCFVSQLRKLHVPTTVKPLPVSFSSTSFLTPSSTLSSSLFSQTQILFANKKKKQNDKTTKPKKLKSKILPSPESKTPKKQKNRQQTQNNCTNNQKNPLKKKKKKKQPESKQKMVKKKTHYVVVKGRKTGVFCENWNVVEGYIKGFTDARYKGFYSEADAQAWYNEQVNNKAHQSSTNNNYNNNNNRPTAATAAPTRPPAAAPSNTANSNATSSAALAANLSKAITANHSITPTTATTARKMGEDDIIFAANEVSRIRQRTNEVFDFAHLSLVGTPASSSTQIVDEITKGLNEFYKAHLTRNQQQQQNSRKTTLLIPLAAFTDGACSNNGKPYASAGSGIVLRRRIAKTSSTPTTSSMSPEIDYNCSLSFPLHRDEPQTNQRAELTACVAMLAAMERFERTVNNNNNNTPKVIFLLDLSTDSIYCIKGATEWRKSWTEKKRKESAIQNSDLFKLLFSLLDARANRIEELVKLDTSARHELVQKYPHYYPTDETKGEPEMINVSKGVRWSWVKGHQSTTTATTIQSEQSKGNCAADEAAVAGSSIKANYPMQQQQQTAKKTAAQYLLEGLMNGLPDCNIFS